MDRAKIQQNENYTKEIVSDLNIPLPILPHLVYHFILYGIFHVY